MNSTTIAASAICDNLMLRPLQMLTIIPASESVPHLCTGQL